MTDPSSEPDDRVEVTVNGAPQRVPRGLSVDALLVFLEFEPQQVAVERNLTVIRRAEFSTTVVEAGDTIEVVTFFGGG